MAVLSEGIPVVDQLRGPAGRVGRRELERVVCGEAGLCRPRSGPGSGGRGAVPQRRPTITTPAGLRREGSFSAGQLIAQAAGVPARPELLEGRPGGVDVYRDRTAGEIVTIARPPSPEDDHGH